MRAQTTIDFAIGISVFLIALIFILTFVPGILDPFTATGQSDPVVSDRLGDKLSQDLLGNPDEPYVLDRGCTVAFFAQESASDCRFDPDDELHEQVGLTEGTVVNVTVEGNVDGSGVVWWDESEREFTNEGGDIPLRIGNSLDDGVPRAGTSATRVVSLDGEDLTMRVVVAT